MIGIVADTEAALNRMGKPCCGPVIFSEAVRQRAVEVHPADLLDVYGGQAAGASGGAPFMKAFDSAVHDGSLPAASGGPADAEPARDLGRP